MNFVKFLRTLFPQNTSRRLLPCVAHPYITWTDSGNQFRVHRDGSRTAATSKRELFVIKANGFQPLTIITNCFVLDVAAALYRILGCYLNTHEPASVEGNDWKQMKYALFQCQYVIGKVFLPAVLCTIYICNMSPKFRCRRWLARFLYKKE